VKNGRFNKNENASIRNKRCAMFLTEVKCENEIMKKLKKPKFGN
jgi:hypothetical protein